MTRFFTTAALAAASLIVAAAPASAQGGAYYSATPAGKLKKASVVTRNTIWKCTDGVCTANKGTERDGVLCELVVQRVGELSAFTVGGAAYDADALKRCNARAR